MARADAVVIGAGIAGVSAAYQLAVRGKYRRVVVVDPRPPLTLTSDKSTECYRNWWPNLPMVELMNRSIDLLEEAASVSGGVFDLTRRGYLFVTAAKERLASLSAQAEVISGHRAGPVRRHPGETPYGENEDGVDILGAAELAAHFPYLTKQAAGALHVRRAGWFSAQQLGSWMLDRSRDQVVELLVGEVVRIHAPGGRVAGVRLASGETIDTPVVVVAAGPMSRQVAGLAGIDLPLRSELHLKVAFRDHLGIIPRDAPMLIWSDTQRIPWTQEERRGLEELGREDLLGEMPVFCHGRPEGGGEWFLGLWEYHREIFDDPVWPIADDPLYPEVVIRGLSTMIPGLAAYGNHLPEALVDGGYYTKTVENRPLVGPAGPEGLHLLCGLGGFGVMVSMGAADLLAAHVAGERLPEYADAFLLARYDRPGYLDEVTAADSGQL